MQFVRLQNQQDKFYEEAIALYERNFIVSERRDADEQRRIMQRFDYHFEIILDANRLCGFILYWETNSFIYLEHLCIHEQFRGRGIGSSALNYLKGKEKTIILEVEPIVDEITDRRKVFYESNGFFLNSHKHIQVKYRREDSDVILLIMTSDREISSGEYDNFYEYMVNNVQISEPNVSSITVEKAKQEDDFSMIAELIYYSDNYIYPYMFNGVEEGKRVLSVMIKENTIYHLSNIYVARANGVIVGTLIAVKKPFAFSYDTYKKCFQLAAVSFNEKHKRVWNEYYALMENRGSGVYVANACIASSYRGKGIGKLLFSKLLEQDYDFELECVKANTNAVELYRKLGFEIVCEYSGFTDIPCYKMEKQRRK